jgi:hypothetical protein
VNCCTGTAPKRLAISAEDPDQTEKLMSDLHSLGGLDSCRCEAVGLPYWCSCEVIPDVPTDATFGRDNLGGLYHYWQPMAAGNPLLLVLSGSALVLVGCRVIKCWRRWLRGGSSWRDSNGHTNLSARRGGGRYSSVRQEDRP